jgi:hypothetical protein
MLNRFASQESANDNNEGAAFVIETAETAAGIVVRQSDGYRFFAADEQFHLLDGSIFKSPKAAQKAADLMRRAAARDHAAARRFGGDGRPDGRSVAAPGKARA